MFYSLHLWNEIPSTAITDLHGITANTDLVFMAMTTNESLGL